MFENETQSMRAAEESKRAFDSERLRSAEKAYYKIAYFKGDYGKQLMESTPREEIDGALRHLQENEDVLRQALMQEDFAASTMVMFSSMGNSDMPEVAECGRHLVRESIDAIIERLKQMPRDERTYYFDSFIPLLQSAEPNDRMLAYNAFRQCSAELLDGLNSIYLRDTFRSYAESLMVFEQTEEVNEPIITPYISDIATVQQEVGKKIHILITLCESANWDAAKKAREILQQTVTELGHDPFDMYDAWRADGDSFWTAVSENLNSIKVLESRVPGITVALREQFGIKAFRRYPIELLIKQFEQAQDLESPYGVVLYPKEDWNGAFDNWIRLDKIQQKLGDAYILRVLECDGKYALARALIGLNNRYGSRHKISFAIIGGHGQEHAIHFGHSPVKGALTESDLTGKGAHRANEYFESNPTIVLQSCSTGASAGIGQKLSKVLGAEVIAPSISTSIVDIDVAFNQDGKPVFTVEFADDKEDTSVNRRYVSGMLQPGG